jgi:hypothetical protein
MMLDRCGDGVARGEGGAMHRASPVGSVMACTSRAAVVSADD